MEFIATNITKEHYLDWMELVVSAYSVEQLETEIPADGELFKDIHWYSRITSVIGILLAKNRIPSYKGLWLRMMHAIVSDFAQRQNDGLADYSVKEIMLCMMEVEPIVSQDQYREWKSKLAKISPERTYTRTLSRLKEGERLHNVNIYNMTGEFLREKLGLTDTTGYFQQHIPVQLAYFDENGMYQDPNCPILYDLTTRCQLQIMLHYGYDGPFAASIDEQLKRAGSHSLMLQSAAFELSYGGRSSQYLFNEALLAANFEYEAARYKRDGNSILAQQFKRAAHLATRTLSRWCNGIDKQHIKNFYDRKTMHGCEPYGYYDKYMITLACFIYLAYLSADDSIGELPCPAEAGCFVFETSRPFHKLVASLCGQSIEVDTNADPHYDANGLGRYHISGVPSEYILSMPFSAAPNYANAVASSSSACSICAGFRVHEQDVFLSGLSIARHETSILQCSLKKVSLQIDWFFDEIGGVSMLREVFTLADDELRIHAEIPQGGTILYQIPLFVSNGRDTGTCQVNGIDDTQIINQIENFTLVLQSNAAFRLNDTLIANRNGQYRVAKLTSDSGQIEIMIKHLLKS